jgi:hypothetical protein
MFGKHVRIHPGIARGIPLYCLSIDVEERDRLLAIIEGSAQMGEGVREAGASRALGIVGPEQPGKGLAAVESTLYGKVEEQGAHLVRV